MIKHVILEECKKLAHPKEFVETEFITKAIKLMVQVIRGKTDKGIILSGRTGVGKTLLLKAFNIVWNEFNNVPMEQIRASQLKTITIKSEGYATADYRMPFLSIDDFGSEPETIKHYGTDVTPFSDIIHYRSEMEDIRKILIATTNLSPKMIGERYGDRTLSRLKGENLIILIKGDDHRTT